jgi:hypothetical protein
VQLLDYWLQVEPLALAERLYQIDGRLGREATGTLLLVRKYHVLYPLLPSWV